jgi:putative ABC transport system substrate-binding protein
LLKRLILLWAIIIIASSGPAVFSQEPQANAKHVAVICSDSSVASIRSLKGITQSLEKSDIAIKIIELNYKADGADNVRSKINLIKPDLIISIGSPSTIFIKENFPNSPLVFSTVLNPETSGIITESDSNRSMTGASLDIPIDIQFQKFKMVYRSLNSLGVIYTDQTSALIDRAREIAPQLGLELVAIKIESDRDVPRALDSLCRIVDGIWTIADDSIYTPQATKFMILVSLRNKKPIMGFSPSFVKSGALLGLNYDYKDIGRRAGDLALRYFQGESLAEIPVAAPGVIYLHINLKTANQLGIEVDQSLVDISKEIYK